MLRYHEFTLRLSIALACAPFAACFPAHTPPTIKAAGSPQAVLRTGASGGCADSILAFRRVIAEFQSRQQNVAISVGVLQRGRIVFREAFGFADKEAGLRADPAMAFSIASISKAFTGAALLKLVEEGRIDLDAEIQRYVPDFPRHPSGTQITVRMLASHLSGLRHWGPERNDALYARHFDDVRDILPLFRDSAWVPGLPPLTRYSYSSYGYNVLAMAIQNVSGVSYQQYVTQAVLDPLQLRSVQFDRPGLGGTQRAARYSWYDLVDFHELSDAPQRVPDWDYSHNMAGGGLIANVDDLLTFGRAMRSPGFLTPTSVALVWTRPSIHGVESPMSVGWFPRVNPLRLSINGSNAGVQAGLTVWKDADLVVAVLANSWGRGSRSGELMDAGRQGLMGRLAAICSVD